MDAYMRWFDDGATGKRYEHLIPFMRWLENEQARAVIETQLQNAYLYHRTKIMGIEGEWRHPIPSQLCDSSMNIIETAVDTAMSLIARFVPHIVARTFGADYTLQKTAKQLERYYHADRKRMGVDAALEEAFRDAAAVSGTGFAIVEPGEDHRPCVRRVSPFKVRVDEREWASGHGRHIYLVDFVDADMLLAQSYVNEDSEGVSAAAKQKAIKDAAGKGQPWTHFRRVELGNVPVVEAWRLPCGDMPGMHMIATRGSDLLVEEYTEPYFPLIWCHWSPPVERFWGRGITDQLRAAQFRIDQRNDVARRVEDLHARPRYFLDYRDAHIADAINNDVEQCVYVTRSGKEYNPQMARGLMAEFYTSQDHAIERAMWQAGISQTTAGGQKPAGVESAVAIRQAQDVQSGRQALPLVRFEKFHLTVAERTIRMQRALVDGRRKNPSVIWKSRDLVRRIEWPDLDESMYLLDLAPASMESLTPAARSQQVIEWAQAGFTDRVESRKLLDHPDLEASTDLAVAAMRDLERTMELLEDDDYEEQVVPDAYQDLERGIPMMQFRMLKIKGDGAPEEVLERFRVWINQAQQMQMKAQQAMIAQQQAQAMMTVPGMDGGGAMAPMQSPMNPPDGMNDASMRLSPQAMGLVAH